MPRIKNGYSLTHAYKYFKKKYKDRSDSYKITEKQYKTLCKAFNESVIDLALEGKGVKLPHSLGMLWVKKFKMNWDKPPIDLNATKKEGKIIYHLNAHSNGWCARWQWTRRNQDVRNLIYYNFDMTKTNKQRIPPIMKQENGYKRFFTYQKY